jgi:hypothetical protein
VFQEHRLFSKSHKTRAGKLCTSLELYNFKAGGTYSRKKEPQLGFRESGG